MLPWRARTNRRPLLRDTVFLSRAQFTSQMLRSGPLHMITTATWTRQLICIDLRITDRVKHSYCRSLHTRLDAWDKDIKQIEAYPENGTQDAASHPINPTADTTRIFNLDRHALATKKIHQHGLRAVEKFSIHQERSGLEQIFVHPVLHTRYGSRKHGPACNLPTFFRQWFEGFSQISQYRLGFKALDSITQPDPCIAFAELLQKDNASFKASETFELSKMLSIWRNLTTDQRHRLWIPAILYVLREDSRSASELLLHILDHDREVVPAYVVGDAVALICSTLLPNKYQCGPDEQEILKNKDVESCLRLLTRYLECYEGVHQFGSLSRYTIGVVTKALNGTQVEKWIKKLTDSSHLLTPGDRLYLAIHATEQGKPVAALDLLRTIPSVYMGETFVAAACDMMLRTHISSEDIGALRSQMLLVMLELGVRPDERLRDLIVAHAMKTGDRESAWNIHEKAMENGMKPSARTYIHLLDGVKHTSDLSTLFSIYREARQYNLPQRSPHLGNAFLRAIHRALDGSRRSFDTMMDMYAELFDLRPIWALGIGSKKVKPQRSVQKMHPPLVTLQAMIVAGIKACTSLQKLTTTYERWIDNIRIDSARFAYHRCKTQVARSFIVQFDRLGARQMCNRVMDDFLNGQHQTDSNGEPRYPIGSHVHTAHDVKLWTSLLHSYAQEGQLTEAERILQKMKNHGINPDAVTFEVLLLAYARDQNIPKTVETLQEKHQAGYDLDEWTLLAIGEIKDRSSLRDRLQEMTFVNA